ncbi:hypothetical protein SEA_SETTECANDELA_192 [Mycobacterium phage Settecandela]|nr:hypothetical protein SEA_SETTECANDELA_192 [Mycobacterium phage Settecandela]
MFIHLCADCVEHKPEGAEYLGKTVSLPDDCTRCGAVMRGSYDYKVVSACTSTKPEQPTPASTTTR